MDPDPLASADTITLLRGFSAVVDTNRIFGHYAMSRFTVEVPPGLPRKSLSV